jgi:predicted Holliday junction resolvase-like endonuclease
MLNESDGFKSFQKKLEMKDKEVDVTENSAKNRPLTAEKQNFTKKFFKTETEVVNKIEKTPLAKLQKSGAKI